MSEHQPETSIVIRAFNEERWLPSVFSALEKQKYRNFEVLVVDSGSVDNTRDIASENGARIVRIRSEDFTFGYSLNYGIRAARGRYIVMVSAHTLPVAQLDSDEVFLLGDNRAASNSDSRTIGPISVGDLRWRVEFRYWPIGTVGPV